MLQERFRYLLLGNDAAIAASEPVIAAALRERPAAMLAKLRDAVYPSVAGTDYARLGVVYSLLSQLQHALDAKVCQF